MMGSGAGGHSSSTSNLSPLAPPFTVDRINPKPNSDPLLHYSESTYAVEPFTQQWQYAHPSAPSPEMVIDSTGITSVPVSDDHRFSASASSGPSSTHWSAFSSGAKATGGIYAYGCEVKPYYSPYAPPMVGNDNLLVEDEGSRYNVVPTSELSVTSQHDYTQGLFDLEYGPRWVDNLGFNDGKRAKRSEYDVTFSSGNANVGGSLDYINQLYRGGHDSENKCKFKEDSGVFHQNFSQVSDGKVHIGCSSTRYMEDKLRLEPNPDLFSYSSNKTLVEASTSPYVEYYPSVMSWEMQKDFPNYQNTCSPYEKHVRSVDTPSLGPASVVRAPPAVVIRPPFSTNGNMGPSIVSHRPTCGENVGGVLCLDLDSTVLSKLKDSGPKPSSKINGDSFETNLLYFSKQESDLISSTSVKELSSPMHSGDTSGCKTKARFGSQLPDVNGSNGFDMTGDSVQMVSSTEDSSDIIEHHNTAVDSPCWKGAPSSQFSTFDLEADNSNHAKSNLSEHYRFGHEEHQNLQLIVDSNRVFSEKVEGDMGNENECSINGLLASERTLDTICSTKGQSLLDGAKDTVWASPLTSTKGLGSSDVPNMLRKESHLLNNSTSIFDMKAPNSKRLIGEEGAGMTLNDFSEGAAIAVHAEEKFLSSPDSQKDASDHTILPDTKLNVPAMIVAIYNLSELLCFHLSSEACSLEEENTETLKHVISNLNTCLSKKVMQATIKPEPKTSVRDTSEIHGGPHNVGTISGGPHIKSEAVNSHIKFDYLHMHDEERSYNIPGKKDEKSMIFSPLRDDFSVTGNDDMTKAIKKILDENFQFNEEMHSQALLFKSLWLEAEAKLCSISYKARFDRTKIQMEEIEHKAPQENEDIAELMSQFCISPDPTPISELTPNACDGTSLKPTLKNISISSSSGHTGDIESSMLAKFNILKSREDNPKPINTEEKQLPEMVDGDAGSIMARFNILKSREENPKSIGLDEEKQPKMIDGEFLGEKHLRSCIRNHSEDETLNMAQKPQFLHQSGSPSDGKLGSFVDGTGYEYLNEHHLSVTKDPMIRLFKSSTMINENNSGWHDSSSSSDWEHVLKDDFSWNNF